MDCASDRLLSPTGTPRVQHGPRDSMAPFGLGVRAGRDKPAARLPPGCVGGQDSCGAPWGRGSRGRALRFSPPSTLAGTGLPFLLCPNTSPDPSLCLQLSQPLSLPTHLLAQEPNLLAASQPGTVLRLCQETASRSFLFCFLLDLFF